MAPLESLTAETHDQCNAGALEGLLASFAARPNQFQRHAQGAISLRARHLPCRDAVQAKVLTRWRGDAKACASPWKKSEEAEMSPSPSSNFTISEEDEFEDEDPMTSTDVRLGTSTKDDISAANAAGRLRGKRVFARGITCDPTIREAHFSPPGVQQQVGFNETPASSSTQPPTVPGFPDGNSDAAADEEDSAQLQKENHQGVTSTWKAAGDYSRSSPSICSDDQEVAPGLQRERQTSKMSLDNSWPSVARVSWEYHRSVTCGADGYVGESPIAGDPGWWPLAVRDLLHESAQQVAALAAEFHAKGRSSYSPAVDDLSLVSGVHSIPHPDKAESGGADSWFVDAAGEGVGIADGVGEWEWRFKVNARLFADQLMEGCKHSVDNSRGVASKSGSQRALESLQSGFQHTRAFGSSTALVATLSADRSRLGVVNIGDSSLLVLRRREVDPLMGVRCVGRTKEQQHCFNCPYQLSRLPTPEDYPKLILQGKDRLVRAMKQQKGKSKSDTPEDSDRYSFPLQEGDMILLGTDGVFDNLYVNEICELTAQAVSPAEVAVAASWDLSSSQSQLQPTDPARIAQAVARAAYFRSLDRSAKAPFSENARQAGLYHTGGKMDDITCLCAWVYHRPESDVHPTK